jgi:hypothetical protein
MAKPGNITATSQSAISDKVSTKISLTNLVLRSVLRIRGRLRSYRFFFLLMPVRCCLLKLGGEVDGRIEGIVAGLSRLMMGILKKEKGRGACLPHSARSRASPGRAISYPWRAIFRGCTMQGRTTAKGSKNRIVNSSHHHHQP